jgi:hypothetical protein
VPTWVVVLSAVLIALLIWRVGMAVLRSITAGPPGAGATPREPEDVEDLDVYLVCEGCGTELKVSRLGELQIPRHCGEKMQVVRRPHPV